ncbi:type II toxin-antitoxin system HicB family antitoxin [bacterium]|nr:type II toxin-antitoxin system HicB family antitoxin [bacterium]
MQSYTVLYELAEEGGYVVHVPALPGCMTQGETLEEAREMAADAIKLYLDVLRDKGRPIPPDVTTPARIEKIRIAI